MVFDKEQLGRNHYKAGVPYNQIYDREVLNGWTKEERDSVCGFNYNRWNQDAGYVSRQLGVKIEE